MENIKQKILNAINIAVPLQDYQPEDCIFSQKYAISPAAMVYILQKLSTDFSFTISEDFIDALEMCTFGKLEELIVSKPM